MDVKPYKIPYPFKKLSKERVDKIVADIANGSTHKYAAESNSVSETQFNLWRRQGAVDLDHEVESLSAYLVVSLAKIKQEEISLCRNAIKHDEKGHKGAEWTLEHAYQRDFSTSESIREINEELQELKEVVYGRKQMDTESNQETGSAA